MGTRKTIILISIGLIILTSTLAAWLVWRIQLPHPAQPPASALKTIETGSHYKTVTSKPNGWFNTGQNADIALSAFDFNNTGGALSFNHLGNIASDGRHLLVADRNNNRVLIWNTLPKGNIKPDIVLGQKNFITNNPGTGMDNLDWPVSVATDGKRVFVADTYNNRILIWNSFPAQNGQSADLAINDSGPSSQNPKRAVNWPWAVWTNGQKLIVTSTGSGSVLIWNSLPTQNNQAADIILKAGGNFGTPRSIASDGKTLMIGDHNAKPYHNDPGNFFWSSFPTRDDQPYNFFISSHNPPRPDGSTMGEIFWGGVYSPDGEFWSLGDRLLEWKTFPRNSYDLPSLVIGDNKGPMRSQNLYQIDAGDGSGVALAGNTLYLSLSNGNRIIGFNTIPSDPAAKPDFVIGSPDINTNTLLTNFIMSNPAPATDGKSLFVISDFDGKLYVYKHLPDQSGAHPDYVIPYGGWANALYGNTLAVADTQRIYIWKTLPTDGHLPDVILEGRIGNIQLQSAKGIAIDNKYFYISDSTANKIYVFKGIPAQDSTPLYTISINQPFRLSSDGQYLAVATTLDNTTGHVKIYKVDRLSNNAAPVWTLSMQQAQTNLPQSAVVSHGSLFVSDTGFNRVLIWKNIADALQNKQPDTILGASNASPVSVPHIGQNTTFWPSNTAFDGSFLWVGEFKFSERLLRFSVH